MNASPPAPAPLLEDRAFLVLVVVISLAFGWILWPFFGVVLWSTVIAILFAPVSRRLSAALRQRRTLAALVTMAIILVLVILPSTLIVTALVQEAAGVYAKIQSRDLSFGQYFEQVWDALPDWATGLLGRLELTNLGAIQERLSTALMQGSQFIAAQALNIGQNTFDFLIKFALMVYLLFFLLRDGDVLARRLREAIPLRLEHQRALVEKFTVVIRATVKGTIVVALLQGALGGLIFWILGIPAALLWAALMAILSLLPAIGAGLVWLPVAVYLLATGAVWQGLVLIAYGVLVIGLVDNVVRPILVGQDTKMPDYVVLITTLGGLAIFGINGFVIGPVIAAMFIAVWDIFTASRSANPLDRTSR